MPTGHAHRGLPSVFDLTFQPDLHALCKAPPSPSCSENVISLQALPTADLAVSSLEGRVPLSPLLRAARQVPTEAEPETAPGRSTSARQAPQRCVWGCHLVFLLGQWLVSQASSAVAETLFDLIFWCKGICLCPWRQPCQRTQSTVHPQSPAAEAGGQPFAHGSSAACRVRRARRLLALPWRSLCIGATAVLLLVSRQLCRGHGSVPYRRYQTTVVVHSACMQLLVHCYRGACSISYRTAAAC